MSAALLANPKVDKSPPGSPDTELMGCHRATPLQCFLGSQPQTGAQQGEEEHRGVLKDRTKSKTPQSQPPDTLFLTIVLLIQPCPRVVGAPRTIAHIWAGCFSPKAPRLPAAPGKDPLPLLTSNLGCPPPAWHPGGTQPVKSKFRSFAPASGSGGAQALRTGSQRHELSVTSSAPRRAACPCGIRGSTQDSPICLCQGLKLEINGKSPERVGFPTRRDKDFYGLSPRALIKH